ncbi:MAG TPA: HEAT repeat domain-containing protein [Myxococcaceae bacterium]|nr:HEAT repeat domain-containing protein [Myxococcaceae bacterium]
MNHNADNLSRTEGVRVVPALEVPGKRSGPVFAGVLYVLLASAAALALWARNFPGVLPRELAVAAPVAFFVFSVGFAIYRLRLVRAKKYPAFKAFFQIGAAFLFVMLLLPQPNPGYDATADHELGALLEDPDWRVRALAAEVIRYRAGGAKYGSLLVRALSDPDARVREAAHRSLVFLNGRDLGTPEDGRAIKAWGERFR